MNSLGKKDYIFAVMPLLGGQGGLLADYAHHITASPPGFENPAVLLT